MKGYIYTMYAGADPGHGWRMSDPIFGPVPTLGACVPNIRRLVQEGDYVFVVTGRIPRERQFVVGGFRIAEKINALTAYERFPENRLQVAPEGQVIGNVIVDRNGNRHRLDTHSNFASRVENYLVGCDPNYLTTPQEFEVARSQTLNTLTGIFGKKGKQVYDVIGRYKKMDASQVGDLLDWLQSVKK